MYKIAAFLTVLFISIMLYLMNPPKHPEPDTSGSYMLSMLLHIGPDDIEIVPLAVYADPNWGFYMCNTDKENMKKISGDKLIKHNVVLYCARFKSAV